MGRYRITSSSAAIQARRNTHTHPVFLYETRDKHCRMLIKPSFNLATEITNANFSVQERESTTHIRRYYMIGQLLIFFSLF